MIGIMKKTLYLICAAITIVSLCSSCNREKLNGRTLVYVSRTNPKLKWELTFIQVEKTENEQLTNTSHRITAIFKEDKFIHCQGTGTISRYNNTIINFTGLRSDNVEIKTDFKIYTFSKENVPLLFKVNDDVFELQ